MGVEIQLIKSNNTDRLSPMIVTDPAAERELDRQIAAVRAFNRFWTTVVTLLNAGVHQSPYNLTEARVIYELAQVDRMDLLDLRRRLGLDPSYLSRIVGRFRADGLLEANPSPRDRRRQVLGLTGRGREVFAMLDRRSTAESRALLTRLDPEDRRRLVAAMTTIRELVERARPPVPYRLRPLRPGDLGWVVQRHGVLYAEEYSWDASFEALVARIVADYAERRREGRDGAWIAELEGEPVGCVFCVEKDPETAQLRLLLVEPRARGLGIGRRLVDECTSFARAAGYRRIVLWTNDVLVSARRLYQAAGFRLVGQERHHSFGHDLVGETWVLELESA